MSPGKILSGEVLKARWTFCTGGGGHHAGAVAELPRMPAISPLSNRPPRRSRVSDAPAASALTSLVLIDVMDFRLPTALVASLLAACHPPARLTAQAPPCPPARAAFIASWLDAWTLAEDSCRERCREDDEGGGSAREAVA